MQSSRLFTKHLAKVFDVCVLIAAFVWAGIVLSDGMTFEEFMALRIKLSNGLLFALLLIAWHNLFIICGLYVSKRLTTVWAAVLEVCKATLLAALFLIALAKVFHLHLVTPIFVLVFWVLCTGAMVGGRLLARSLLLALRSRGRNRRFILVVGTNDRAIDFARQIAGRPELGYKIVGFVDDDWNGIQNIRSHWSGPLLYICEFGRFSSAYRRG